MIPTDVSFADAAAGRPEADAPEVFTRDRWSDSWAAEISCWAEAASWACGPALPTAQLRYVYGRQRKYLSNLPQRFMTVDKLHWPLPRYVQIYHAADDGGTSRYWYGLIEVVADQVEGIATVITGYTSRGKPITAEVVTGQQVFTCFGMEQLLARHQIRDSRFDRGSGAETNAARLCFNAHGKPNRGNTDHSGAKVFYYQPNDKANCSYWSTRDIVEYLLRYQTPRDALNARQVIFECADLAKLPNWDAPVIEQEGATTLSLIQRLASRQRLLTHWFEVVNDGGVDKVRLRIETLTPNTIALAVGGGATVPEATRQLRLLHDRDNATTIAIKDSELQVYDVIYARGAPELSVGTFSWRDTTLQAGWTAAQQTAYQYGASQLPNYQNIPLAEQQKMNVAARADPRLDDVFSKFTIPPNWDQTVGDGVGGARSIMFPGPAGATPVYYATCYVEHGLPLYPGIDYSAAWVHTGGAVALEPRDEVERSHVLVVFRKPTADQDGRRRWFRAEDMGQLGKVEGVDAADSDRVAIHVSVPSHSHGVQLRVSGSPQHAIAHTEFVALDADDKMPEWDFADGCLVTLALPSGQRVFGRWPATDPAGRDSIRVLEIDAGGRYERVFVAPFTVVGIDKQGELLRSAGGWLERPANVLQILEDLARVAGGWYTIPHRVVTIETSRILGKDVITLGDLIQSVGDNTIPNNTHVTTVNATVSEIRVTWPTTEGAQTPVAATLTINTFAGELDPLTFGPSALNPAALPFGAAPVHKAQPKGSANYGHP